MEIHIQKGDIKTVAELSRQLPEFHTPYNGPEIEKRIKDTPHLILISYYGKTPIGFKVGYERDDFFYSWLGGILPKFRKKGIAKKMADRQEKWVLENGYDSVTFKTRNKHKAMLCFALKNEFYIIGFEEKEEISEHRIWLRKDLR